MHEQKSHFYVLQVTESWAEPGNEARQDHSLVTYLSRVWLVRMKVAEKETHRDGSRNEEWVLKCYT